MTEEEKKTLEDAIKILHDLYYRGVVRANRKELCFSDLAYIIDMADALEEITEWDF